MAGNYSLGEAVLGTDVDLDGLVKGLKEGKKTSEGWVAKIGGHLQTIGKIAMGVGAAIGGAVLAAGAVAANAIDQAADAIEMMGKFDVVFGDFGTAVAEELTNFGEAVGRSKYDLMGMASSVQDLLVPMGLARDEASEMSTVLTELAVDVGSFNNVAEADVLEAFKSALIGNTESVKRFGVIINQTTLDQELMNMGIEKGIEGATEQQKVQARMNMIMRATADAQGDAARTADSWANTMRGLKARVKDAVTELGLKLIPVVQPFLNQAAQLAETVLPRLFDVFDTSILPVLERVTGAFEAVVSGIESGLSPMTILRAALYVLTGRNADLTDKIMGVVGAVKDFVTNVWEFLAPVREWIAENVTLKDVLIGVGIALATVILPLLWSVISAVAPVIAVFAGVVLAVTLLRKAWETDFLGIRTTLIDVWENTLKPAFEEVGEYFKEIMPEGGMTFKEFIQEKLLPALEKIGLFIVQKVIPFVAQMVAWWITRIPPAINAAIAAFNWVKTAIGNVSSFIQDTLIPTLKSIVTTVGNVINAALTPFRLAVSAIGNVCRTCCFRRSRPSETSCSHPSSRS
jgi:phage-related protein